MRMQRAAMATRTFLRYTIDFRKKDDNEYSIFIERKNCYLKNRPAIHRLRLSSFIPIIARMQLAGSLVNAARQNYRNHANDKIFAPRGNFASSTMASR